MCRQCCRMSPNGGYRVKKSPVSTCLGAEARNYQGKVTGKRERHHDSRARPARIIRIRRGALEVPRQSRRFLGLCRLGGRRQQQPSRGRPRDAAGGAIHNGRARAEGFSLDREGFILTVQPSRVGDFYDDLEIAAVYEAEAEALLARRFAIVNVWRSIRGTVRNAPLALCDASSVAPEDLVSVKRQARDRIGEIQQAVYNPAHRWYSFPEMAPNEALLIKTYDSATDGRARFTIHTAFEDPAAAADAAPRESFETRCFAFF